MTAKELNKLCELDQTANDTVQLVIRLPPYQSQCNAFELIRTEVIETSVSSTLSGRSILRDQWARQSKGGRNFTRQLQEDCSHKGMARDSHTIQMISQEWVTWTVQRVSRATTHSLFSYCNFNLCLSRPVVFTASGTRKMKCFIFIPYIVWLMLDAVHHWFSAYVCINLSSVNGQLALAILLFATTGMSPHAFEFCGS
jgi:hypothetical protein